MLCVWPKLLGEKVGETIGYRIRFETKISNQTNIEVVTEGILTRMLHSDNSLEGIAMVIFDEFHERSIHADVTLALCRESQQILRPDLRSLISTARATVMEGCFGTHNASYGLNKVKARIQKNEIVWVFFGVMTANAVLIGKRKATESPPILQAA